MQPRMPSRNGNLRPLRTKTAGWWKSLLSRQASDDQRDWGFYGGAAMTISKKLYLNFGAVLAMVVVLLLVNLVAVEREHSAKTAAQQSMEMSDATDHLRSQMMQNRLFLSNYLLSGDTRETERMEQSWSNRLAVRRMGNRSQLASAIVRLANLQTCRLKKVASAWLKTPPARLNLATRETKKRWKSDAVPMRRRPPRPARCL